MILQPECEVVLTSFIVVVNLHHSVLHTGHFVVSDNWKSDADLGLVELQIARKVTDDKLMSVHKKEPSSECNLLIW